MKCFYRISDESYKKEKLPGAGKRRCLENFLAIFGGADTTIIADNCHRPLLEWLDSQNLTIVETNLGNAGSFLHALDMACTLPKSETVYFVEDDYLHRQEAPKILPEGFAQADYVTLYDHPDKYGPHYNFGEPCRVYRKPHSHWRTTISTCMTFAARVKTLKEDRFVFHANCVKNHPNDHEIFVRLKQQGRTLASCIPGAACHIDLTYSLEVGQMTIDEWALDIIIEDLKGLLKNPCTASIIENAESTMPKIDLLAFLTTMETMEIRKDIREFHERFNNKDS
jgi:hypothetical protein